MPNTAWPEVAHPVAAQWDNVAITKSAHSLAPQSIASTAMLRPLVGITSPANGSFTYVVKPFPLDVRPVRLLIVLIWSATTLGSAAEFKKVIEGVSYIRVGASENNVYIVGPTSHPLLIDSHYDYDVKETIAAMENAGIKTGHIRAVVITHAHDDHFGGAGALARWSHAPIWAHVATAAEIEDPWSGFARPGTVFPNLTMTDWTNYHRKAGEPARVERVLREGDVIEHEGLKLEVAHSRTRS